MESDIDKWYRLRNHIIYEYGRATTHRLIAAIDGLAIAGKDRFTIERAISLLLQIEETSKMLRSELKKLQ